MQHPHPFAGPPLTLYHACNSNPRPICRRSKVDSAVDAAGVAWALGFLGYKDGDAGRVGGIAF